MGPFNDMEKVKVGSNGGAYFGHGRCESGHVVGHGH